MLALRDLSKDGLSFRQNLGVSSTQNIAALNNDFQQFSLLRTDLGVVSAQPVTQATNDFQPFNLLRTNLGILSQSSPTTVTVQDTYPINFNAFKVRTNVKDDSGSGGAIADPKTSLQDRLLCLYPLSNLNKAMGAASIGALTAVNAPTTTTGKLGNCYQFNRTNNQKIHDPNNLLQISQCDQFTIGCWFQSTDNNTYAPPIGFGRDAVGAFEVQGERTINTNEITWYISTDGTTSKAVGWDSFVVNAWFFILIEYSKKLGRFALYVDNILRSEDLTISTSANIVENTSRGLTFGAMSRDLVNTSFHFSGLIDESFVALGNTTQTERDWLWNSGNGNTLV